MGSQPPNYNTAVNFGYNGSPHQQGAAYPPPMPTYPPENAGYPPQGGNAAYPPPPTGGFPGGQGGFPGGQGGFPGGQGGFPGGGFGGVPGFPMPPRGFPMSDMNSDPNADSQNSGQPKPDAPLSGNAPWQDDGWAGASFNNKAIRMAFIRKVYLILMIQLFFTAAVVVFFVVHEPTKLWVQQHSWIYWPSYGVFLVTYIVLVCCPSVRRKWPVNFICLAIFTVALTYMAGMVSSFYNTLSVVVAMGITAAVSLAISIFACQTKWDFTKCGGILMAGSIALFVFGIVCIIWYATFGPNRILHCVYGGVAALLFSMFLAYDTQMLIGGRKYELSPEDHIFGALQLYLDIVYLFMIILSLFGGSD